jgi:predicted heme/steroid binding protein
MISLREIGNRIDGEFKAEMESRKFAPQKVSSSFEISVVGQSGVEIAGYDVTPHFFGDNKARLSFSLLSPENCLLRAAPRGAGLEGVRDRLKGMLIDVDGSAVFEEYREKVLRYLETSVPAFLRAYQSLLRFADPRVPTLQVEYHADLDRLFLKYNEKFILFCSALEYVGNTQFYMDFEDCYVYTTSFLFCHEIAHILLSHLNNPDPGILENVWAEAPDCYINSELLDLLYHSHITYGLNREFPLMGGVSDIVLFGTPGDISCSSEENIFNAFKEVFAEWTGRDCVVSLIGDLPILSAEGMAVLRITPPRCGLGFYFHDRSKDFMGFVNSLAKKLINGKPTSLNESQAVYILSGGTGGNGKSTDAGSSQPTGGEQGGHGEGKGTELSGDSSSDEGHEGGSSREGEDQDSDKDSGQDSEASGDSGKTPDTDPSKTTDALTISDLPEASQQLVEALRKAVNEVPPELRERLEKDGKTTEDPKVSLSKEKIRRSLQKLVKSMASVSETDDGKDASLSDSTMQHFGLGSYLVLSGRVLQDWRRTLDRILRNAFSLSVREDSNVPSARLEGELGREVDTKRIRQVAFLIDCSGSMGPGKFGQVLGYIEDFVRVHNVSKTVFHIVYWGGGPHQTKYMKISGRDLTENIKKGAPRFGGTDLNCGLNLIKSKVKKLDLLAIYTDAVFGCRATNSSTEYLRQNTNRLVWVVPTVQSSPNKIGRYAFDGGFKRRMIQAK